MDQNLGLKHISSFHG